MPKKLEIGTYLYNLIYSYAKFPPPAAAVAGSGIVWEWLHVKRFSGEVFR
jgi:hypothetical protein